MEKKYWLHRISYYGEVSYDLLKKGYLTIGWSMFLDKPEELIETIRGQENGIEFRNYTEKKEVTSTSRWALWNFGKMNKGDVVVVPMYGGQFGVYKIINQIQPISNMKLDNFIASNEEEYEISDTYLVKTSNKEVIDLGFFIEVESILEYKDPKPRDYAESKLRSRMKIRQTNADISDLANEVNNAIVAKEPHDVYFIFMEEVKNKFISDKMFEKYTPDQIELLVEQYFLSVGADKVRINAKNEAGKPEGSDADVTAEFTDLKTTYYVQVKKHEGETDMHGLEQIKGYIDNVNKNQDDENEVNIAWFLTTAVFAEEVKQKVKEYRDNGEANIRLIDGREFIEMIFNAGIDLLDLKNLAK